MNLKTISYTLIAFFFPFLTFAQTTDKSIKIESGWSFHLKYGMPFFEDDHEDPSGSSETKIGVKPGIHLIAGGGYRYGLTEEISLSLNLLYEFGKFSRTQDESYVASSGEHRETKRKQRFQTHSLLHPIKLNVHFKRINFSVGAVGTFHFTAKMDLSRQYFIDGEYNGDSKYSYRSGHSEVYGEQPWQDSISIFLERELNLQLLLAIQAKLSTNLFLDFEFRHYLAKNRLGLAYYSYDVVNPSLSYYEPFTRTLSIGVSYFL